MLQRRALPPAISTGGRTIYAIGDVHGRLDLLDLLIEGIRRDSLETPGSTRPMMIFVGDYIDRGASSRGVVDRVLALKAEGDFELRALKGNHEEALLTFLEDAAFGPAWCEYGGADTLWSYGVRPPISRLGEQDWRVAHAAFVQALPAAHHRFFSTLDLFAVQGDYVFVHAGLRPGVPLRDQSEHDLLWIREAFLHATAPFEKIVVHGHTPANAAVRGPHRIGIDTGAYATGVLTAARLKDGDCRFMEARLAPGGR